MLALCQNQSCSQDFLMSLECITSFVIPGSLTHVEPKITLDLTGCSANHVSKHVLYSCLKHVSFNCSFHISYSGVHLSNCNARDQSSWLPRPLWPMQLFPDTIFDSGLLILQFLTNTSKVGEKKEKKEKKGKEERRSLPYFAEKCTQLMDLQLTVLPRFFWLPAVFCDHVSVERWRKNNSILANCKNKFKKLNRASKNLHGHQQRPAEDLGGLTQSGEL